MPPEVAVGTRCHAQHGTKTTSVFLPADGEASWLLLPSLVSLLSGGRSGLRKLKEDKHQLLDVIKHLPHRVCCDTITRRVVDQS